MAKKLFTQESIKQLVSAYVNKLKQAGTLELTTDNTAKLVDKIAKIVMIPQHYADKLPELEGEFLPLGKTIEEAHRDLILPVDYDPDGTTTMAPHDPTYRPNSYSFSLNPKTIPTTKRKNDLEKGCNSQAEFEMLVNGIIADLYDSNIAFRYACKRQLLGNFAKKCIDAMSTSKNFAVRTAYEINEYVKKGSKVAVVFKKIEVGNTTEFEQLVKDGTLVELDLVTTIAKPVDTATGEDFIIQLKKDVEIANDFSDGHSLNGGTLGATPEEGLYLYVRQGIIPNIEVHTQAGAFHAESVAIPAKVKPLVNFGDLDENVYAILIDTRGLKIHPTWLDVEDQKNAQGGFYNYYLHSDNTGFISRNTFIKVYKGA